MTVWLPLVLMALTAFGVFQYKAHTARVRKTAACAQERHLATERLERAILESTTKPNSVEGLGSEENAFEKVRSSSA